MVAVTALGAARPTGAVMSDGASGRTPAPSSEDASWAAERLSALRQEAIELGAAGRRSEALVAARSAVELVRRAFGDLDREGLRLMGTTLVQMQKMLNRLGYRVEAVQVAHDVVTFCRKRIDAGERAVDQELAAGLNALGAALEGVGEFASAAEAAREEVTLRRELARDGCPDHLHQLANGLLDLGRWQGRAGGDERQAARLIQEVAEVLCPLADAGAIEARLDLARTHCALATLWGDRHVANKAVPPGLQAVAMNRALAIENPQRAEPELAKALHNVGIWLSQAGRREDALAAADEAVTMYRRFAHTDAPDAMRNLAWSLVTFGNRLAETGDAERAQGAYREAGALMLRLPIDDARLWAWLASIPASRLSHPKDLRDFLLPLLSRLASAKFAWRPEVAGSLAELHEQAYIRAKSLFTTLTKDPEELSATALVALLGPTYGEDVALWAHDTGIGHRVLASIRCPSTLPRCTDT